MGYIKMKQLRKLTETELGEHFDIKEYHDVILTAFGPLELTEREVIKYIDTTKQKLGI